MEALGILFLDIAEEYVNVSWKHGATVVMAFTATLAYGQSSSAWAQQQAQDIRELRQDVETVKGEVRNNTKDIGFAERTITSHRLAHTNDHDDHETRLREVERNLIWVLSGCSVLAFITPGLFHLLVNRRNGRNGHVNGNGGPRK